MHSELRPKLCTSGRKPGDLARWGPTVESIRYMGVELAVLSADYQRTAVGAELPGKSVFPY